MVLDVFPVGEVLLLSSCAVLCFVGISGILRCISWYHFIFLATNSSSWLTQAFFVVLDILHLLVYDFSIKFALESSSYLEHRFFLLCILLYCLLMLVCLLFLVSFIFFVLSCCSSEFLPTMWFLLPISFL